MPPKPRPPKPGRPPKPSRPPTASPARPLADDDAARPSPRNGEDGTGGGRTKPSSGPAPRPRVHSVAQRPPPRSAPAVVSADDTRRRTMTLDSATRPPPRRAAPPLKPAPSKSIETDGAPVGEKTDATASTGSPIPAARPVVPRATPRVGKEPTAVRRVPVPPPAVPDVSGRGDGPKAPPRKPTTPTSPKPKSRTVAIPVATPVASARSPTPARRATAASSPPGPRAATRPAPAPPARPRERSVDGDSEDDLPLDNEENDWSSESEDEVDWQSEVLHNQGSGLHTGEADSSDAREPEKAARKIAKRRQIVEEILNTESTYVHGLGLMQQLFLPALKPHLSALECNEIFMNSDELYNLHKGIVKQLEVLVAMWDCETSILGASFLNLAPYLKIYKKYAANFDRAMAKLTDLTQKNTAFATSLQECHADKACGHGLTLGAYMLEPIQRIPRYKLLLKEHLKNMPDGHPDQEQTTAALEAIEEVASGVNEGIREKENETKLVELQRLFPANFKIYKHGRILKTQAMLSKMCRKGPQPRLFILFSDLLVYCQTSDATGTKGYSSPRSLQLDGMLIADIEGEVVGEKHCFEIKSLKKSFIVGCPGVSEKLAFVDALNEAIKARSGVGSNSRKHRGSGQAPMWIPDSAVSSCQVCSDPFSVIKRRHHCRMCGCVVCGACSTQKLAIDYNNDKLGRVCDPCYSEKSVGGGKGNVVSKRLQKMMKSTKQRSAVLVEDASGIKGASDIVMSGYLVQKLGGLLSKSKKLWFVLKTNFVMYSFRAPEDRIATASTPLPGHTVTALSDKTEGRTFCLEHTLKKITFEAESVAVRDKWVSLLTQATRLEDFNVPTTAESITEEDEPDET